MQFRFYVGCSYLIMLMQQYILFSNILKNCLKAEQTGYYHERWVIKSIGAKPDYCQ